MTDGTQEADPDTNPVVIWLIDCGTGCTCCNHENHKRGPFRSAEDAEKRKNYYLSDDSKYWPLGSQYARRGRYSIHSHEAESLSNDRFIVDDEVFHGELKFIEVNDDGTISDNESERFE